MGFRLVERVYSDVTDTSSTEQAILAYLAFRADDADVRPCHPSMPRISSETHFNVSTVKRALVKLRKRQLLLWASGGRKQGGRPMANSYAFNLPAHSAPLQELTAPPCRSSQRPPAPAHSAPLHQLTVRPCTSSQRPPAPAHSAPPSYKYQKANQPSVIGGAEAEGEKASVIQTGGDWLKARSSEIGKHFEEMRDMRERERLGLVDEAMKAAGVSDMDNKRIFSSTLIRCFTADKVDAALETINTFASERRHGEHEGLKKPAAELNKRLARLTHS